MKEKKFNKVPLSPLEKEKKAEEFLKFIEAPKSTVENRIIERRLEKEEMKAFPLRIPFSLFQDLKEIAALTGISINAVCLELLRPVAKKKLKDIKEMG